MHRKILSPDVHVSSLLILLSCGARYAVRWVLTEGILLITFWAWIPEIPSSNPDRVIFVDNAYIGLVSFLSNIWKIIFHFSSNNFTTHKVNKYVPYTRQFMLAKWVWFIYEHHRYVHSLVTCCTRMIHFVRKQMFSEVTMLRPCERLGWIQLRCECYVIVPMYRILRTFADVGTPGELSFRMQSTRRVSSLVALSMLVWYGLCRNIGEWTVLRPRPTVRPSLNFEY
jgi:hypothetical protein